MKITPAKLALVEAVKAHALANYNAGGWDVITECWDDEMIAETIGAARTPKGAIAKFADVVSVWADRQADAAIASGEANEPSAAEVHAIMSTLGASDADRAETERAEAKARSIRIFNEDHDEALSDDREFEQAKRAESNATAPESTDAYVDYALLARMAGANGHAAATMSVARRINAYTTQTVGMVRHSLTPAQRRRIGKTVRRAAGV